MTSCSRNANDPPAIDDTKLRRVDRLSVDDDGWWRWLNYYRYDTEKEREYGGHGIGLDRQEERISRVSRSRWSPILFTGIRFDSSISETIKKDQIEIFWMKMRKKD